MNNLSGYVRLKGIRLLSFLPQQVPPPELCFLSGDLQKFHNRHFTKRSAMYVTKLILWEVNSIFMQTLSFVLVEKHAH